MESVRDFLRRKAQGQQPQNSVKEDPVGAFLRQKASADDSGEYTPGVGITAVVPQPSTNRDRITESHGNRFERQEARSAFQRAVDDADSVFRLPTGVSEVTRTGQRPYEAAQTAADMETRLGQYTSTMNDTERNMGALTPGLEYARSAVDQRQREYSGYEQKLQLLSDTFNNTKLDVKARNDAVKEYNALLPYAKQALDRLQNELRTYNSLAGQSQALQAQYNSAMLAYQQLLPEYNAISSRGNLDAGALRREGDRLQAGVRELEKLANDRDELRVNRGMTPEEVGAWQQETFDLRTRIQEDTARAQELYRQADAATRRYDNYQYNELLSNVEKSMNDPSWARFSQTDRTMMTGTAHYDKNGQYASGKKDVDYAIINGDSEALSAWNGNHSIAQSKSYLSQVTARERAAYNYLYATKGKSAADDFIEQLTPVLNDRQRRTNRQMWTELSQQDPWGASAFSVLAAPAKMVSLFGQAIDLIDDGKIDQNAAYNQYSNIPKDIRNAVSEKIEEKWGKEGSFIYQTGMSMADFLFNSAITGEFVGIGSDLTGVAKLLRPSLAIMGSGAAADTVIELRDRGVDSTRAFALGAIAGLAEVITENVSLENLLNPDALADGVLRYILKNMAAEGSEELGSDIINWAADALYDLISGQKESEWEYTIRENMKNGMGVREATEAVLLDRIKQAGLDAIGGALSGGIMAGGGAGINAALNTNVAQAARVAVAATRADLAERNAPAQLEAPAQMEAAREIETPTNAQTPLDAAVAKLAAGEPLTQNDAKRIMQDTEAMQTLRDAGVLPETVRNDSAGRQTVRQAVEQYVRQANAPAENGPPVPGQTAQQAPQTAQEMSEAREGSITPPAAEANTTGLRLGGETEENGPRENAPGLTLGGNTLTPQPPQSRLSLGANNRMEVTNNGTQTPAPAAEETGAETNVPGRSGERGPGLRAGGQAGQLGRSPEGWRTLSRAEKAAARRAYADDVNVQPVSARSLGVNAATEDSTVRVYPKSAWEPDLQRIAAKVEKATGKPVTFVLGEMKVNAGGKQLTVRGVNTGSGIIVQADDPSITAEKIATHEAYHAFAGSDPGLSARVLAQIRKQFPENRLRQIAETYLDKLYGIVDLDATDKATLSKALAKVRDEICADAYAGINAFSTNTDEYTGAARQAVTEARRENAAATARRTGPPEQYSAAEEEKRRDVYDKNIYTRADVVAVQNIGRKNVRNLTSEERKSVESFARKAWGDMKEKSPFFEAWFGDWRANDQSPVSAADVSKKNTFKAGKALNPDTNRMISWGDTLKSETRTHLRSGGIADQVLGHIQDLIENAVLLDTKTSTPDSKSKMPGTAFMHSLYALARSENSVSLLKLFAEEAVSGTGEDFTRAYDLRDIKTIAMSTNGVLSLAGGLTDANIATIRTVADLFRAVKAHDPEFKPSQASKIVNEDGTPKVVYHGTDKSFTVFDRTKGRSTMDIQGMFFSPWEIDAGGYGPNVGAYYLNIKHPANEGTAYKALNRYKGQNDAGIKARDYLISQGYDGVNNSDEEYIAFYPEQIKSAADNVGTFDQEDPDVRYSSAEGEETIPESAAEYGQLKRQGKAKAPKTNKPVSKSTATIAKADLRKALLTAYSIPGGSRAEMGKMIDALADQYLKNKRISWKDREDLINKLWENGVMFVDADDGFQGVRDLVRHGRIYVPQSVKNDFGDDWNSFRREAMAEGIYLVNDENAAGWDQWNAELSDAFPGLFDENEYDPRAFLENVVDLARKGKGEKLSLAEYAAKSAGAEYATEEDMMDNLERQADYALKAFAEKAGLEIYLKDRTGVKLAQERQRMGELLDKAVARERERGDKRVQAARESGANALAKEKQREEDLRKKEREHRKEVAQRLRERQAMRELQQKTLKQLQWLSRNQNKFPAEAKRQAQELLEDMDVLAVSSAEEMHIDNATGKTWKDLRDMYLEAKEKDPNWLPSAQLEKIVMRLDAKKIGDLDMSALNDLYKAAVGLRTELYNRNNLIDDELHRTMDEVYENSKNEIQDARGGYKTGIGQKYANMQLTPMNRFLKMAGWNPDSTWYSMAKGLESGERAQRKFKSESMKQIAPVLEQYRDWMKTADGQGKNAIWYEIKVPESWEYHMGDKPVFSDKTVTVYMTPAQKVHMYLESKNLDNLRHMEGGRTFADKELYSKGKRTEAFAKGTTVKLLPETVKSIVSDLTAEEQALANALEQYYNSYSKQEINRISNILYGYDKAMGGYYAPIMTNSNYTKSEPGIFDLTAEGVGNLKERQHAANPSLNVSAFDAFEKSVDRTGKFVGMAIPIRNMTSLMNWREQGNSMQDVLAHKWGDEGKQYVMDLLTELQSGRNIQKPKIEQLTNEALSRYIGATFGFNPSIVLKQFASFPLAGTYLGNGNLIKGILSPAPDTDLISKYSSELDYRMLGYATPETATLKNNPNKLQEKGLPNLVFGGGAITWMDGVTVKAVWNGAEQKVKSEQPDLDIGTQEQIDAGQSPFYQAVAKEFEEAVSRSQPMYDTLHRADIMREGDPITRTFTLFKTVPMQELNMLAQTIGEAQYYKSIGADKETQTAARQKAGRAFLGILAGNLMIGVISFLNALLKNGAKAYKDKDGELNAKSIVTGALKQYAKDAAGIALGGSEAADILSAVLFGDKWYGLETPGIEQISSIIEKTIKASQKTVSMVKDSISVLESGGDWFQYMKDHGGDYVSSVEEIVRMLATYGTGLPVDNVKAYLLGAAQHISPAIKTAYEDVMSKADKSGLKGLTGASLEMRTGHILQDRAGEASERAVETVAGLYEAGYKDAVPASVASSYTVNGETRSLSAADDQLYRQVWRDAVGSTLNDLTDDKIFRTMGQAEQAKVLKSLYEFGSQTAKAAVWPDFDPDKWVNTAADLERAGIPLSEWLPIRQALSGISGKNRKDDVQDYINSLPYSQDQKKAIYTAEGYKDADSVKWSSGARASGRSTTYAPADLSRLERAPDTRGGSSGKTYSPGKLRLGTPERRAPVSGGLTLGRGETQSRRSSGLTLGK